jgi:hypothetical protein
VTHTGAGRRFWMIPALTFLVGLLLGGAVVGASTAGDDEGSTGQAARPTQSAPASTESPATRPAATVAVPGACLEVADSTDEVLRLIRQATESARDLNASQLSSVVRQLQQMHTDLSQQSAWCRSAVGSAVATPSAAT